MLKTIQTGQNLSDIAVRIILGIIQCIPELKPQY
jgi:hypothetical protein